MLSLLVFRSKQRLVQAFLWMTAFLWEKCPQLRRGPCASKGERDLHHCCPLPDGLSLSGFR